PSDLRRHRVGSRINGQILITAVIALRHAGHARGAERIHECAGSAEAAAATAAADFTLAWTLDPRALRRAGGVRYAAAATTTSATETEAAGFLALQHGRNAAHCGGVLARADQREIGRASCRERA